MTQRTYHNILRSPPPLVFIATGSNVSSLLTSIGIPNAHANANATAAAASKHYPTTTPTSSTTSSSLTLHESSSHALTGGAVPAAAPPAAPTPPTPPTTLIAASKALLAACTVTGPTLTRSLEIAHTKVGIVIGTKGSIIGEMMKKTGTKIVINQDGLPEGQPRDIVFTGNTPHSMLSITLLP